MDEHVDIGGQFECGWMQFAKAVATWAESGGAVVR